MRLDVALVARGLARSRNQAAQLIRRGRVRVDAVENRKPSHPVAEQSAIETDEDPWASRAAHKLLGALEESGTHVPARVLDAGASTGGFTAVCLERGAERVYAVDVGHGQLVPELRHDPRVVVREGLNLRTLRLDDLDGELVDLVVADLSFISLTLVLEPMLTTLTDSGTALLLVKPQFEVGRDLLGASGVIKDPTLRQSAVDRVIEAAAAAGWVCDWQGQSVLPGASGNVEFFIRLTR